MAEVNSLPSSSVGEFMTRMQTSKTTTILCPRQLIFDTLPTRTHGITATRAALSCGEVATGEHALADEETVADVEGLERALTAMVDGGGIGETTTCHDK